MLPGVSAEDCLFADLGIDPAVTGLQSYEATNFLYYHRQVDTSAALVLWQVSVVGETAVVEPPNRPGLAILADHLQTLYPPEHEVTLYEASPYPVGSPFVQDRASVAARDGRTDAADDALCPTRRAAAPERRHGRASPSR